MILLSFNLYSQEKDIEKGKEYFYTKLEKLKTENTTTLLSKISQLNKEVLFYIKIKGEQCHGEFSSIEINSQGESEIVKRKLTKEEKKVCLIELIYFRKKYIKQIFKLRKKILTYNHKQEIHELELIKKQTLKNLDLIQQKI